MSPLCTSLGRSRFLGVCVSVCLPHPLLLQPQAPTSSPLPGPPGEPPQHLGGRKGPPPGPARGSQGSQARSSNFAQLAGRPGSAARSTAPTKGRPPPPPRHQPQSPAPRPRAPAPPGSRGTGARRGPPTSAAAAGRIPGALRPPGPADSKVRARDWRAAPASGACREGAGLSEGIEIKSPGAKPPGGGGGRIQIPRCQAPPSPPGRGRPRVGAAGGLAGGRPSLSHPAGAPRAPAACRAQVRGREAAGSLPPPTPAGWPSRGAAETERTAQWAGHEASLLLPTVV